MDRYERSSKINLRKRIIVLFWIIAAAFFGLIGHLAYIQVFAGDALSKQAVAQQSQLVSLEIPPRGQILDCKLRPLTSYQQVQRLIVFPAAVKDKVYASTIISSVINKDISWVLKYMDGNSKIIPVDLTDSQAVRLKYESIEGVVVAKIRIRDRKPSIASHVLGYIGKNDVNEWTGKMGIESIYDSFLKKNTPQIGARIYLDGRGKFIPGLGYKLEEARSNSRNNVVLTIDKDIQNITERVLDNSGIKQGAVVVMEAGTGNIVAMASRPEYSLNKTKSTNLIDTSFSRINSNIYQTTGSQPQLIEDSYLNRCLAMYQPGSVFKVIVAAAAFEEKLIEPDSVFVCTGEHDPIVKCYNKKGHGLITFENAIALSCNPFFARVGIKLGTAKLIEYAKRFGIDRDHIIGFRNYDNSKVLDKIAQNHNLVNASIGQWPIEANPVQITAMMATIANNGVFITPKLVNDIRDTKGNIIKAFQQDKGVRAVSETTAEILKKALNKVTTEGTGKQAWLAYWGSAGKTGSAQVGKEKIDAWFSGYAPLEKPAYVATVMVTDGESGGKTAAPIFREIMQQILDSKRSQKNINYGQH